MQTILTEFLIAGLLPIGEDDEKLALLEGAATELSQQIKTAPILAQRFALVALDDETPSKDGAYASAATAITGKWATISNRVGPNPIQVYRAVLLRGIEIAAKDNIPLQLAILLTARNLPSKSKSSCEEAIAKMLSTFAGAVQPELTRTWISSPSIQFPRPAGKPKKSPVGRDELLLALGRASGPADQAGKALPNPNPHWPNAGQPWAFDFAGRATDGILAAIDTTSRAQLEDALRETLQPLLAELEKLTIRDAKSELLWIRSSAYSPSARRAFRGMNNGDLILHAVLDVARAVNSLAPPSVEYFLRDLVETYAGGEPTVVQDFLISLGQRLATEPEGKQIAAASTKQPPGGRRAWIDIAVQVNASIPFEEQAGVLPTYAEKPGELAVRLYRELQVLKLLGGA